MMYGIAFKLLHSEAWSSGQIVRREQLQPVSGA